MLKINTQFKDSVLVIDLDGDLHVDNFMVVWNGNVSALDQKQTARIVVNMNEISFIDSRGLAVLITWLKRCRERSGDLFLCAVNPAVKNVIELTRLDMVFKMFEDEDTAVHAFV